VPSIVATPLPIEASPSCVQALVSSKFPLTINSLPKVSLNFSRNNSSSSAPVSGLVSFAVRGVVNLDDGLLAEVLLLLLEEDEEDDE